MKDQQQHAQRAEWNVPRRVVLQAAAVIAICLPVALLITSLSTNGCDGNATLFNGTKRDGAMVALGARKERLLRRQPHQQSRRAPQRRWLYVNKPTSSGAACDLTSETYRFVLDPATNKYMAYVEESASASSSSSTANNENSLKRLHGIVRWNQTSSSYSNNTLATDTNAIPAFIQVRACSCLTRISNREDFCPAHFNTCVVHGKFDPVSCYTRAPSDMIVRVAWTASMVSILILSYTWIFTEYGATARRFIRRTCHYRNVWSTPEERQSSEREAARQLEHLLRHEPRRAAYMFRHRMLRERDRQRRQQALTETWWYQRTILSVRPPSPRIVTGRDGPLGVTSVADTAPAAVDETTSHGAAAHSASGVDTMPVGLDLRPRLRLKVKVYRSKDACYGGDDEGTGSMGGGSSICKGGTSATAVAFAGTSASPSTGPAHSWALPMVLLQLNTNTNALNHDMDHATFDVMDDETERGVRCAICLTRLRDGDIIGDIPCCHSMHKDCLKDWLPRKNRCPLCQTTGIALLENESSSMNSQHLVREPHPTSEQSATGISPTTTTDSSSSQSLPTGSSSGAL